MTQNTDELHLLVIEDNPGDFLLIEDYLQDEIKKPVIVRAKTFAEAKEHLVENQKTFDVVLLDLSLPDAQGESLVIDIVKLSVSVPVIVLTGYSEKDFGIKTLSLGVSDYLLKDELNSSQLYKSIAYSRARSRLNIALNKSEENYRYLFELSPLPTWVFDLETAQFLKVNEAAIKHYGYSQTEFLSMTVKEIKPPFERENLIQVMHNLQTEGIFFRGVTSHLKKNGQVIQVDIQTNRLDFENKSAVLVIATDITDALEKQAQIIKSNERLNTAQEIGKLGYWEFDIKTEELFWSDEVYHIFGLYRAEFTPNFDSYISIIHPDDLKKFHSYQKQVFGMSPVVEIEHRIIDSKGNIRHVYQKSNLVKNSEGIPVMLEGITQDITETREYIQAIEMQNAKLREIAWMQSHVVRAPVARILGLVNLLDEVSLDPGSETLKIIQYIKDSTLELDQVIKNIVRKSEEV